MKRFTQEEALEDIFSAKKLSPKMNVYKSRYNKGKLAQKAIDEILRDNNFVISRQALYIKA